MGNKVILTVGLTCIVCILSLLVVTLACGQGGSEVTPSPMVNEGSRFKEMGGYSQSGSDYLHVLCDTKLNRLIYLYTANQGAAISVEPYQC